MYETIFDLQKVKQVSLCAVSLFESGAITATYKRLYGRQLEQLKHPIHQKNEFVPCALGNCLKVNRNLFEWQIKRQFNLFASRLH